MSPLPWQVDPLKLQGLHHPRPDPGGVLLHGNVSSTTYWRTDTWDMGAGLQEGWVGLDDHYSNGGKTALEK